MDFNEHRAASIIVEFDDARAEKLKKIKLLRTDFL